MAKTRKYKIRDEYGQLWGNYKSLTSAARMVNYLSDREGGRFRIFEGTEAETVVEVDTHAPEFMTKTELRERLAAEVGRSEQLAKTKHRLEKAAADRENQLIDAGLIPLELLHRHRIDFQTQATREDSGGLYSWASPNLVIQNPLDVKYTLILQGFPETAGKDGDPFARAIRRIGGGRL